MVYRLCAVQVVDVLVKVHVTRVTADEYFEQLHALPTPIARMGGLGMPLLVASQGTCALF